MNQPQNATQALSRSRIIGYGLGDMANNFAFSMGVLFLLNYYTDVVGLPVAVAGGLLSVARIHSALMDIVAGRVVDRTSTAWGRFRPCRLAFVNAGRGGLFRACPLVANRKAALCRYHLFVAGDPVFFRQYSLWLTG